jgi:centrosomal protein CEP104
MEEQLKSVGLQLARLEAQKREAVANEDYDLAKRIRDEIVALEMAAAKGPSPSPSPVYNNGMGSSSSGGAARSMSRSQVLPRAGAAAIMGSKGITNHSPVSGSGNGFSPREMYPPSDDRPLSKPKPARSNSATYNEESLAQTHSRRQPPARKTSEEGEHEDEDDSVRGGDNGNVHFRGLPDAESLPDPEELPPALEKENDELIRMIGLFLVQCFYSNLWNHRDAAIRKVTMELDKYPQDPLSVVRVCSVLVQSGAGDRIAQVSLSAFRLLERLLSYGAKIRRDDMCGIVRWV